MSSERKLQDVEQGRRIGWTEAIEVLRYEHDYARKHHGPEEERAWELAIRALMEARP